MNKTGNIRLICATCVDKAFPLKGKFKKSDVKVGMFVKKTFRDGREAEHMWVIVKKITAKGVKGTLDNNPISLTNVRYKDEVFVGFKDIEDVMEPY